MNTTKFHRAIFATIALFLLPICAAAQINFNATWYFTDFVGANMGVRQVQIDPLFSNEVNRVTLSLLESLDSGVQTAKTY